MGTFFIGLGFQKCATTWLSMRLRLHPDVWYPPINELHFWDSYEKSRRKMPRQFHYVEAAVARLKQTSDKDLIVKLIDRLIYWRHYNRLTPKSFIAYKRLFRQSRESKAFGEITPSYVGLSEDTLRLIIKEEPNVKVFLLMREPISRVWSQIRHERRLRPENVKDTAHMLRYLESKHMSVQANYDIVLTRLRNVFPSENIGCFFFEHMVEDQAGYLKAICGFLDIGFSPVIVQQKRAAKKTSGDQAMPEEVKARAIELYGDVANKVERLLGRVPQSWRTRMDGN